MSGSDIHFVARPGDANNVHVDASSSGTWTISDVSGAPINAMSLGCSSTAANTVVCHAPAAGVEPRSTPTTGTTR
jgi:hypothetical protein